MKRPRRRFMALLAVALILVCAAGWWIFAWQTRRVTIRFVEFRQVNGELCGAFVLENSTQAHLHYTQMHGPEPYPKYHFREDRPNGMFMGPGRAIGKRDWAQIAPGERLEFCVPLYWHHGGQPITRPFALAVKVTNLARLAWILQLRRLGVPQSILGSAEETVWSEVVTP